MSDVPTPPSDHPLGVWEAMKIGAFAVCFIWIPYAFPGLEELRVVGDADPLPLSRLVTWTPRQGGASLAGALRRPPAVSEDDEALLEAVPLPAPIEIPSRARRPRPPRSGSSQALLARIDPSDFEGLTREIEDPEGSMRGFYSRLARVVRGERVLARMGVYGTSTNGADRMTSQLRSLLQSRFGDGGKGWVPMAAGWRYQRHQDVDWSFDRWNTFVVNRSDGPLDRYGYGGVLAVDRGARTVSRFGTVDGDVGAAVSSFRIFHQAWPEGGAFTIAVDDGSPRVVETRAEEVEDRVETVSVPDGSHRFVVRPVVPEGEAEGGGLRMYGVAMEREGPGVVVDGLALIGAFTRVLRLFDEEHLAVQVAQRDPNLLVFWMGANDAVSESVAFVRPEYIGHYRGILRRFQDANPGMSCMVMSILDKGVQRDGRIVTRRRVPRLVDAQREAAFAEGCAFFDTYEAIGGNGTMSRWYRSAPRLVGSDLGHLTAAGSRVVGTLVFRALLKGFDDWIADGEVPLDEERAARP